MLFIHVFVGIRSTLLYPVLHHHLALEDALLFEQLVYACL